MNTFEVEKSAKLVQSKQSILTKLTLDSNGKLLIDGQPVGSNVDLTAYLKTIDADIKYELKDSTIVKDNNYVHTDNNYTNSEKTQIANLQTELNNRYTKLETLSTTEINTLVNSIAKGMNWKDSVNLLADLPMTGNNISDTRVAIETSHIYIWNGTVWIDLGGSANIPMASSTLDGQMSKEDKAKLDLIIVANLVTVTDMNTALANKVDVVAGKQLSTEDYTTTEKTKLTGISDSAKKVESSTTNGNIKIDGVETTVFTQTQADWNETDNTKSGFINNKPTLPSSYVKINDAGTVANITETYSIDKIISLLNTKQNKILIATTEPTDKTLDNFWLDITSVPYKFYKSDGTSYNQVGSTSTGGTTINPWIASTSYSVNDLVIYNNGLYQCKILNSDATFTVTNWNIISGNSTSVTFSGDLSGDSTSQKVVGIQGTQIEDIAYNVGDLLGIKSNGKFGKITPATAIGMTGITMIGDNTTIGSGMEKVFTHTTSTNIVPYVVEQIAGSSITDTHVDFNNSSKYILQDNTKINLINNTILLTQYSNNIMPIMTSSITNGITVSTSGDYTTTRAGWKAFDNIIGDTNRWLCNSTIGWLKIDFGIGNEKIICKYKLSYNFSSGGADATQTPNTWNFQGSNDGSTWINLDTQSGKDKTYWNTLQIRDFSFINNIKYRYYRFNITLNNGNSTVGLDEVSLSIGNYTNTPLYLKTTGLSNFSLSTTDTITSVTIPTTIPTNTSIKCLFSVDNFTNYLYYDGSSIQKFTGTLTSDWGSTSSSYTQLQTLFTNLTVANLTTMLNTLGIIPMNLDFAFQLNTTDTTVTPTISTITMVYTTFPHEEYADIGKYDSVVADYGVKRINNSTLSVKNLKGTTKTIKLLVVTDGSGSGDLNINTLPTF